MLLELKKNKISTVSFFNQERKVPLHAMISSCGFEQKRAGDNYYWDGLKRGNAVFFLWQLTLSGRGMLRYEDNKYVQEAGDAMFLRIPHNHSYCLPKGSESWNFVYFCLYGMEMMRILQQLHAQTGCNMRFEEDSPFLQTIMNICLAASNNKMSSPFDNSAMAYKFAMGLVKEKMPMSSTLEKPEFIKKVEDFCKVNISEVLTVDDMASASGYSRYHFSRLFTEYNGASPALYLRNIRIQEAAKMLQHGRLSIKEIASDCGFMDCSHFCRLFKENYGITPETFRKSGMY